MLMMLWPVTNPRGLLHHYFSFSPGCLVLNEQQQKCAKAKPQILLKHKCGSGRVHTAGKAQQEIITLVYENVYWGVKVQQTEVSNIII